MKHDREHEFKRATLENMVNAMAAICVLIGAQFGQFGDYYGFAHSEIDVFDADSDRTWKNDSPMVDCYVPPELVQGGKWTALDYPL